MDDARYAKAGYTHRINLHRKVDHLGWVFQTFPTTADAVRGHMNVLKKMQANGSVRNLEVVKL